MLRWLSSRIFWGTILVLGGVTLLLQNLEIIPEAGSWFWAMIFLLGGAAFLYYFYEKRDQWWSLIPGFTLLGLSASAVIGAIFPALSDPLGGLVFFIGVSLGFVFVFIVERRQWWAIIPAGVLLTLGIVSLVDNTNMGVDAGAFLFLGIGLTFAILALLPGHGSSLRWAFIPAGVLVVIGLLISAASASLINLIFPAALVVAGLVLVFLNLFSKKN